MADNPNPRGGLNQQTKAVIIVGSIVIVALVGVIVALVLNLSGGEAEPVQIVSNEPEQRTYVVNEENVVEVMDEIASEEHVPIGQYEVSMTMDWTFPDWQTPSPDAFVENVTSNTNDVYFDIEIRATGEVIYQSPVLPVGTYLRNVTLDHELAPGNYPCVIVYHLIDDEQNTLSTLNMGLDITVEGEPGTIANEELPVAELPEP